MKYPRVRSPLTGRYLPRKETVFGLPASTVHYIRIEPRWSYYGDTPELPEPGDRWSYGDWEDATPQTATHVLLRHTAWSDYSGSTVERSNHRSLLQDYPETFTDIYGGHGTSQLMLAVGWTAPGDGRDGLLDEIAALADYPLYDEEDHSALEMELADEAWDSYLYSDVPYALIETSECPDAMEDMIDAIRDNDKARNEAFGPHGQSYGWANEHDTLRDMFYNTLRDQDYGPECEDAVNAYFPLMKDSVTTMAEQLWQARCDALPQMPAWYNPAQETLI